MATLGFHEIILHDLWPGAVNPNLSIPTDGWDGTTHNCVTTPAYPVGTKIMAYEDDTKCPGYYTMIYLGFNCGSDLNVNLDTDPSVSRFCAHAECTTSIDGSKANWYIVTNDCTNSDATRAGGGVAVACASLASDKTATDVEYGWFWCGGVCPVGATDLDVSFTTGGSITLGRVVYPADDGTNQITLDLAATPGDCTRTIVGWANETDA